MFRRTKLGLEAFYSVTVLMEAFEVVPFEASLTLTNSSASPS